MIPLYRTAKTMMYTGLVFLTGCVSVGPDYKAQNTDDVKTVNTASLTLDDRAEQWWLAFNDPVLDRLIELTIANNQNLKEAEANVAAAFAQFRRAGADRLPSGGPSLSGSEARQVQPGFSEERTDIKSYQLGVDAIWNFDIFGKLRRASEASLKSAQASEFQLRDLQVSLTAQVSQTYAEYKGALSRIDVTNRNIASMEKMRKIVSDRLELGFATELDLYRVDADLLGVKSNIPTLTASARRYKNTLIALVGGSAVIDGMDLNKVDLNLPSLNQPLAIGDPKSLLRQRADVHAAEKQLAASTANIGVQTASLYPELSISGFLGFLSGDFSTLGDSGTKAWSVAPTLSWSIFNLKAINANIAIANKQQQASLARFQQTVLNALSEADTSLSDYTQLQKQRHILEDQVEVTKKALSLAQVQYELGAIDLFQVLDIERNALAAEDNLIQAQFRAFSAIVEVYRAFGGGFQTE